MQELFKKRLALLGFTGYRFTYIHRKGWMIEVKHPTIKTVHKLRDNEMRTLWTFQREVEKELLCYILAHRLVGMSGLTLDKRSVEHHFEFIDGVVDRVEGWGVTLCKKCQTWDWTGACGQCVTVPACES